MTYVMIAVSIFAACVAVYASRRDRADAIEDATHTERNRITRYLRRQSEMAATVSRCASLGSRGRGEEAYAAVVLADTADEISECEHLRGDK